MQLKTCYAAQEPIPQRRLPIKSRRFPPPWRVEQIPGGYRVLDNKARQQPDFFALRDRPIDLIWARGLPDISPIV
jgi:hypothetical protein